MNATLNLFEFTFCPKDRDYGIRFFGINDHYLIYFEVFYFWTFAEWQIILGLIIPELKIRIQIKDKANVS